MVDNENQNKRNFNMNLSAGHSPETNAGWIKDPHNPVFGGYHGTCFDLAMLKEGDRFRMWFSWRPKKSIALVESSDGIRWSEPVIVLGPDESLGFEEDINRPGIVKCSDGYHLWYTGQTAEHSAVGYATSPDGITWKRMSRTPVLTAEAPWEKVAVMCPHVLWDDREKIFKMWYSGGEQFEPNALGYATSPDGLHWTKWPANPIFTANKANSWEQYKVTACQVIPWNGWYVMFYIGFQNESLARIGLARSRDGITDWHRHSANPIISPGQDQWDHDAVYKPFAILSGRRWMLWYNGRRNSIEQIGLAFHEGEDLQF
jgi:beta-1,2-mannobiose phosphorylase / 1,2-beta-oligomannan phosphorylase